MSYPGSRDCRFCGFGTPHRCRFRKWVETTRGDRRAFAVPLNSIVFSNAEYPAAVRTWPVHHGRIIQAAGIGHSADLRHSDDGAAFGRPVLGKPDRGAVL